MEEQDVVRSLAALARAARLQVFRALVIAGPRGMTPGVMAEGSAIPSNTLSFLLKELLNSGLVTQERHGRNLIYRASFERMNALLGYLTESCCEGEACAVNGFASACSC